MFSSLLFVILSFFVWSLGFYLPLKVEQKVIYTSINIYILVFLLAIVLSILLRFTNSDYPFGVFKLVFKQWQSTIPPISAKRTMTSHLYSLYTKRRTTSCLWKGTKMQPG